MRSGIMRELYPPDGKLRQAAHGGACEGGAVVCADHPGQSVFPEGSYPDWLYGVEIRCTKGLAF